MTIYPYRFTDAQRMELRSYVELAGEVIAQYWPMRTFIHHNPLHGLESLPFHEAIKRGSDLFGGRGYLPNALFRDYWRDGRIRSEDVRAALAPLATEATTVFAGRAVSHLDVLTASMTHGITDIPPDGQTADAEDAPAHADIASWLATQNTADIIPSRIQPAAPESDTQPIRDTLGEWCDLTLGTTIRETIDREMVKWCSAFLDEGEAAWVMPHRERTFYRAWKSAAQYDYTLRLIGIPNASEKIRALSGRPEEAILESLVQLGIPKSEWERYLSRHLAALPGWTGYIKWRANQTRYPWQEEFPVDLVKYLAVRLFYERELVDGACRQGLGLEGRYEDIQRYVRDYPHAYWFRRAWLAGRLVPSAAHAARQLSRAPERHDHRRWDALGQEHSGIRLVEDVEHRRQRAATYLLRLARALALESSAIRSTAAEDVRLLLQWLVGFPPSDHGRRWLEAFEANHRQQILGALASGMRGAKADGAEAAQDSACRPLAQVVFCIDVRSEVFRRHLEHRGGYETLGLAGFFGVPLDYQPFNSQYTIPHCPVLLKPKNQVREIPRSYHGAVAERHKFGDHVTKAAHTLLHDLKENVITPYVMVEALGWFFSFPLLGKTIWPRWYEKASRRLKELLMPSLATTLTVEKLTQEEAEKMIAAEQLAQIREAVRQRFGLRGAALTPGLLDMIRRKALGQTDAGTNEVAKALNVTPEREEAFYQDLRDHHEISPRGISQRLERITQTGFSVTEQAYFVEAGLRLMGLTSNFARVVLFCAHGSTSQNNPYLSALDCGACGGNQGLPNARAIAAMANKSAVRDLLQKRGITIPPDTHFFAAQHDTTTDLVTLVDLEDVPATHRKDLQRLLADLDEAGQDAALERSLSLGRPAELTAPHFARQFMRRRSEDWAEVRPEWGLSGNSVMVIGRRGLTQSVDLRGRSFLHSYDHRQDPAGKFLETIMTAPLVVAQWINMEHYFSTVDPEVYGSGSKVYHNVVGRIGVMTGGCSDLRIGLPVQTVWNGSVPYHEPMRLLAVIAAPRARISAIIDRHSLLQQLFNLEWVTLVALEPDDGQYYHYAGTAGWRRGDQYDDRVNTASDEGNQDRRSGRTIEVCH